LILRLVYVSVRANAARTAVGLHGSELCRTGQSWLGQDRTGQGRAGQERAEVGQGKGRVGQVRTGQGRVRVG